MIEAVARGDVAIAAAWGPLAGFFAARAQTPLQLTPIATAKTPGESPLPMAFDIAMAARREDDRRVAMLEAFIVRRRSEIDRVLAEFHVPRLDESRRMNRR